MKLKEKEEKEEKEEKDEKETKDEQKTKEKKDNKKNIYKILKPLYKVICCQIMIIFILILLYCKFYNYSDTLIYFTFGAFISIYLNATIMSIKKYKIINSIEFYKKYTPFFFKFIKKIINYNDEIITMILVIIIQILAHLLFPLIALYYVKDYIKDSIKTEYAYIKAFIIFIIYILFNIYIIDSFKVYNKSLELTKTEFNTIVTSIIITFMGLLYYFESIKNSI